MNSISSIKLPRSSEGLISIESLNCAAYLFLYNPTALLFVDDQVFPHRFMFEKKVAADKRKFDREEGLCEPKAYARAISQLRELVRKK